MRYPVVHKRRVEIGPLSGDIPDWYRGSSPGVEVEAHCGSAFLMQTATLFRT